MAYEQKQYADAAAEAVSREQRDLGVWKVWPRYEIHWKGEDAYAQAVNVPPGEYRERVYKYRPLVDSPALFLEFARLADREIDEEIWSDWLHCYGTLGLGKLDGRHTNFTGGRRETLSNFTEAARRANEALKFYEAATAPDGPDVAAIEAIAQQSPGYFNPSIWESAKMAQKVALLSAFTKVQNMLTAETHPHLYPTSDGFTIAPTFDSLLGAMFLQMAWLMAATGLVRRCAAPRCNEVIDFDIPDQPVTTTLERNDRSGGYKTRSDKVYCDGVCKQRAYDERKRKAKTSGQ